MPNKTHLSQNLSANYPFSHWLKQKDMLEKQVAMHLHSVSISTCSFAFDADRVAKNTQHSCVTQF